MTKAKITLAQRIASARTRRAWARSWAREQESLEDQENREEQEIERAQDRAEARDADCAEQAMREIGSWYPR